MSGATDLAARLIEAADKRTGIEALTTACGPFDFETAYQVQDAVVADRVSRGAGLVGAKLGLTSVAKQRQMNVDEPLYGWLTGDMAIDVGQSLRCDLFIQPRCEPEIAFVLKDDLAGQHVTASQVLAATAAVHPAIDVLDSRFAGYLFTLPDVVADNASGAGFVVGGQATDPAGIDLRLTGVVLEKNGELVATAAGAAVLGHPAASVAWLVRALAGRGRGLTAGQVVLSGALTEAVPVAPGDVVVARFDRLGTIELACR
ncbi:MAG TPA: fumarylacetoacetate hydrolase family protein [Streptosporangiaceae bacterium]|nr:fumarylacetoacetate hydrolase family protein [Streptosporangiaceae bacterium]